MAEGKNEEQEVREVTGRPVQAVQTVAGRNKE
jgi:hypothetical protein